ncbi:unnamed protein product [Cuscuta campestris]|uniref:Homeobox domain-containing protein n=1 Tax=Cuscuta campestris TaxID=132261 RepID=A0A484ND73_9ASTE|nr:unnamed protein product [Cuscuta campestris]
METYYSSSGLTTNQRDAALPLLPDQKHTLQSSPLPPMMFMNNHHLSYPDLSQSSLPNHDSDLLNVVAPDFDIEQNLQYKKGQLSLSLAMQVPSYCDDEYRNTPAGLSSFLTPHTMHSDQASSHFNGNKNVEYFSFDLAGGAHTCVKSGDIESSSMGLREMGFSNAHIHGGIHIYESKYLKAAQDLLDEVVNVQSSNKNLDPLSLFCSSVQIEEPDDFVKSSSCSTDISSVERCDLESKMTKLFSLLDKVDVSYKQYHEHMQLLVSSFEVVAGAGAARPYTSLALKTISHQFRCICDAIKKQIKATQESLGEGKGSGDNNNNIQQGERLYRLRQVDQKLRQQRLLQQFGVMRQPWRPLRGLPENAVSILRAWLFEHFLHPYPKETEKITLARQTGLTRSQVANWFINARVRLWKPMIEEMYKEEVADAEAGSTTSPEHISAGN